MVTTTRLGAGALAAALASGALLGTGVGTAFAQQTPAACDPTKYPPVQCVVVGGNRAGAPPLVVNRTIGAPGAPVTASSSTGCNPGSRVTLALLRIAPSSQPVVVGTTTADADGGYSVSGAIPSSASPGVYILYASCRLGDVTSVSTTSFVVVAGQRSSSLKTTSSGTTPKTATTAASKDEAAQAEAAVRAADLPSMWAAPAAWDASPEVRAAVTRAVNLRLTALRTALPATPAQDNAVAAPVRNAGSPTDTTLWYAGAAGAAFLLIGVAGWRRHAAASATTGEASQ